MLQAMLQTLLSVHQALQPNANLTLTGVSSLFNTGAVTVERGPSVPVTGTSASFSVNSVNPQAGANPVFYTNLEHLG